MRTASVDKAKVQSINVCSFYECEEVVCAEDIANPLGRMQFCKRHSDEARALKDAKQILSFWVRANGGAKRLASTF